MTRKTSNMAGRPRMSAGGSFSLTRRALVGSLLLAPLAGFAARAAEAPLKLTSEDRGDLDRVATYLNGIKSFTARFQQVSSGGGLANGKIYLRRPGLLRVEYAPPVPVLLVSDGFWVSYYDSQLDQLTQIPLSQTPIWFLVQQTIAFTPKITVTRIDRSPGALRLSMYQSQNPDAGSASLIFADDPLQLKQWTIRDSQGTEVEIALQDAVFGGELSNNLFAAPQTRRMQSGGKH
jgi:outer membrane lipoprotein-sorting protein